MSLKLERPTLQRVDFLAMASPEASRGNSSDVPPIPQDPSTEVGGSRVGAAAELELPRRATFVGAFASPSGSSRAADSGEWLKVLHSLEVSGVTLTYQYRTSPPEPRNCQGGHDTQIRILYELDCVDVYFQCEVRPMQQQGRAQENADANSQQPTQPTSHVQHVSQRHCDQEYGPTDVHSIRNGVEEAERQRPRPPTVTPPKPEV
ncbi:hypothetical protein GY45DRAFT_1339558 [Cubamyces sp. BRFM 1775]|nr:hypothetical protein GY45DRAFT_1339558 [Cubamyces sp. BRFM 1775]